MKDRSLKLVFFLSLPLALFWTLGFIFEHFFESYLPSRTDLSKSFIFSLLFIVLYVSSLSISMVFSKFAPNFMRIQSSVKSTSVGKIFFVSAICSYIAGAIITFLISKVVTEPDPVVASERELLVVLLSIWLPLWWTLPLSSIATVIVLDKDRNNSKIELRESKRA